MKLKTNGTVDTDYYKLGHHLAYNRGLENIYSYGEPRTGSIFEKVLFCGLQPILIDDIIGEVVDEICIEEGRRKAKAWGGFDETFNIKMWEKIVHKYHGRYPVRIKAVKEGTRLPVSNPLFTIECLHKDFVPLVGHLETILSHIWDPCTVGTNSFEIKKQIYKFLVETGTPENIEYFLHDFGYRGVSCPQEAVRAGMAHLINFVSSDTCIADRGIDFYYGYSKPARLQSVYATEHSVAQSFGPGEGEYDYVKTFLSSIPDTAIGSIVIDTYDPINFVDNVITREDVRAIILNRAGKTVLRPDTGNPDEMINRVLNSVSNNFGHGYKKHYKVVNPKLGALYGDKMDRISIPEIYRSIISNGWSADNLITGSGGGLLRNFNRDAMRFAIKSSFGIIDGKDFNMLKKPVSDLSKTSKTGRLKLHKSGDYFMTISSAQSTPAMFEGYIDSLETVFEMGELKRRQTFDDVICTANKYFMEEVVFELSKEKEMV